MSLGKSNSSSKVRIPRFLRPFLQSTAGVAQNAVEGFGDYFNATGLNNLIAPFTGQEEVAQILGTQRALDPDSAFQTATDVIGSTAEGTPIAEFLPGVSMDALSALSAGGSMAPGSEGVIEQLLGSDVTSGIRDIAGMLGGAGGRSHLEDVVSGKYLYGGEGFDAALDAAMSRIMPQVRTQFGRSGAGGGTGTLAAEAVGDRLGEQFALQYGQERGRQDSAANILEQLGLSEAGMLGDFDLARAGVGLDQNRFRSGVLDSRDAISSNAAQMLASLGMGERANQMDAARLLPTISNLDLDYLNSIGQNIRGLQQAEIDAPFQRYQQFLASILPALGAAGAPVGQSSSSTRRSIGFPVTGS